MFALSLSSSNWRTIRRLTLQEIRARVSGTQLGLFHYLLAPLLMLVIYSWAFSVVFSLRWGGTGEAGFGAYALRVFAGLIPFQFFSEVVNRSPGLVLAYPSYVKKVIFPLETLVPISMGTAGLTALLSYLVFFAAALFLSGGPGWTVLWLPVLWLPLLFFTAAIGWFLSALGVFLRDIGQLCSILVGSLLFLTPVFYPLELVPPAYRFIVQLNPLAWLIEQMRACLFGGPGPDIVPLLLYSAASLVLAQLACGFFKRAKKAFADVM